MRFLEFVVPSPNSRISKTWTKILRPEIWKHCVFSPSAIFSTGRMARRTNSCCDKIAPIGRTSRLPLESHSQKDKGGIVMHRLVATCALAPLASQRLRIKIPTRRTGRAMQGNNRLGAHVFKYDTIIDVHIHVQIAYRYTYLYYTNRFTALGLAKCRLPSGREVTSSIFFCDLQFAGSFFSISKPAPQGCLSGALTGERQVSFQWGTDCSRHHSS